MDSRRSRCGATAWPICPRAKVKQHSICGVSSPTHAGPHRQAIFFIGYADPDTPGGRLKAAKPGETFLFSADAGQLTRRCEMQEFDLTAHANREDLLDFAGRVSPRVILLGHGELSSRQWFEEQLRARHPRIRVVQPAPGLVVEA